MAQKEQAPAGGVPAQVGDEVRALRGHRVKAHAGAQPFQGRCQHRHGALLGAAGVLSPGGDQLTGQFDDPLPLDPLQGRPFVVLHVKGL